MKRQNLKFLQRLAAKLEAGEELTPNEIETMRLILEADRKISDQRVERWAKSSFRIGHRSITG